MSSLFCFSPAFISVLQTLGDGVKLHFLFSLCVSATRALVSVALMQVSGSISYSQYLLFHSFSSF